MRPHERARPSASSYLRHATLFVLTAISVLYTGALYDHRVAGDAGPLGHLRAIPLGYKFAVPLLSILVVHELGHYVAARLHGVPASLPYFIPAPFISFFGTMGAVISMPRRIRSRNALLDIGAAGPLAGMLVALPVLAVGIATSKVEPLNGPYIQEGQSLLYLAMKRLILGPIPDGYDMTMSPMAFAGWAGLLVTALNLLPVGQLDGGHIAYALFGRSQDKYAGWLHLGLLAVVAFNVVRFVVPALRGGGDLGQAIGNSVFWLVWFGLLFGMRRCTGQNHPPTGPGTLSPARRAIAVLCLILFVLLFMPTPLAEYG
jgi:membrane-associated protease RseP (regulator of RpoE activity)